MLLDQVLNEGSFSTSPLAIQLGADVLGQYSGAVRKTWSSANLRLDWLQGLTKGFTESAFIRAWKVFLLWFCRHRKQ